jgi:son of sevenless-like protein
LPPKTLHRYDQLNEIISMSANFKTLRELMNELQPPCIPYLGIYLRDFVFILDGNPEKTENGLINFERLTLLAGLIAKIRQCQLVRYKLCPIEIIQDYLTQSLILLPEEILEAQSYKIEPRKDESAAQLTPKHRASIAFTKRRDT